jgi:hypothetical protein
MPLDLSRRSLLRGLFAAPAIVAAGSIMPVRLWKDEDAFPAWEAEYCSDFSTVETIYYSPPRILKISPYAKNIFDEFMRQTAVNPFRPA